MTEWAESAVKNPRARTTHTQQRKHKNRIAVLVIPLGNLSWKTSFGPKHPEVATVLPIFKTKVHMRNRELQVCKLDIWTEFTNRSYNKEQH